jgi:hypothetical protein
MPREDCRGDPSFTPMDSVHRNVCYEFFPFQNTEPIRISFVLYMVYYPLDLRYKTISIASAEYHPNKALTRSQEWNLSLILAYVTGAHLYGHSSLLTGFQMLKRLTVSAAPS